MRRPAQQLGDDASQLLRSSSLRRPVGDVGAGAVAARDVTTIRQAAVHGPDRVRVDAQRGAELADRWESRSGQEAARVDLVGELPEDLGGDRDVGVALDVEAAARVDR